MSILSNLIVVDVQPHYHHALDENMVRATALEIELSDRTIMFWVGEDLTEDTEDAVRDYWRRMGVSFEKSKRILMLEKSYGFLRPWMDTMPDDAIVNAIKCMIQFGVNGSLALPHTVLENAIGGTGFLSGWSITLPNDPIYIPDFPYYRFVGCDWNICGGAKSECLPEIELLLKGHGINTNRLDNLVWG